MSPPRRQVRRSELFIETAQRFFPPGGSVQGRPSYQLFEDGPLGAIEFLFARRFDGLPDPYPGDRAWTTIQAPLFPPMTFYAAGVDDYVELLDLTVDTDYE